MATDGFNNMRQTAACGRLQRSPTLTPSSPESLFSQGGLGVNHLGAEVQQKNSEDCQFHHQTPASRFPKNQQVKSDWFYAVIPLLLVSLVETR